MHQPEAFAKAMREVAPDRISPWPDGVVDGQGAMVAGWWCEDEAKRLGCSMRDVPLMGEVEAYNEIDCPRDVGHRFIPAGESLRRLFDED